MISEIIQSNQDKLLLLNGEKMCCPTHMILMLQKCVIDCFMPLKYCKDDELIYDTLNGISLKAYLQKKGYTPELLKKILYSIKNMMQISSSYLIDAEYIVLDIRYIYVYKNETFKFILDPFSKYDINHELKQLIYEITENSYISTNITNTLNYDDFDINCIIKAVDNENCKTEESNKKELRQAVLKNIIDTDDCIMISDKDITVGRIKLFNDYKLSGRLVSLRHAFLRFSHETVYVRDHNSKNGTFVNGEKIKPECFIKVKRGDIVSFADVEYILM